MRECGPRERSEAFLCLARSCPSGYQGRYGHLVACPFEGGVCQPATGATRWCPSPALANPTRCCRRPVTQPSLPTPLGLLSAPWGSCSRPCSRPMAPMLMQASRRRPRSRRKWWRAEARRRSVPWCRCRSYRGRRSTWDTTFRPPSNRAIPMGEWRFLWRET